MTLAYPFLPMLPPAEDSTINGGCHEGVVASFDLLCLPGIVMSFLDDSTSTRSSGIDDSARHLCLADLGQPYRGECVSSGTTDTSVLCGSLGLASGEDGGCAGKVKVAARHAMTADLEALMLMLENLMLLLIAPDGQASPEEAGHPLGSETE